MKIIVLCSCVLAVALALPANWPDNVKYYEGYKVIEVIPKTSTQVQQVKNILDALAEQVDVWVEPRVVGRPVHVMVEADNEYMLTVSFKRIGLTASVHIDDVSKSIRAFVEHEVVRRKDNQKAFDLDQYNTLADITDWLQNTLTSQCEANAGLTCSLTSSAIRSVENRDIWIFKIGTAGSTGKKTILIDGLIHCREWIVGGTVFKMMDRLVNQYGTDAEATELLDAYDFIFMPLLNPDGYEFTWTNERLWRKNRVVNGACIGVDLNRNFAWNWSLQGSSNVPCSDLYCGPGPLSEPEAQALDAVQESLGGDNCAAYITYHAYAEMFMFPWGNTEDFTDRTPCERAVDHNAMNVVAQAAAEAIMATYGTSWAYGTSCEVIYATTGASDDHAKGVYGFPYPFNPELRGNSFIIPADEIEPSYQENWNGLVALKRALPTNN